MGFFGFRPIAGLRPTFCAKVNEAVQLSLSNTFYVIVFGAHLENLWPELVRVSALAQAPLLLS